MAKKLTDISVRNLRKPGIVWDTQATGLGIKLTPGGKLVWVMQTIYPGHTHQTKRNLGDYSDSESGLTVGRAREKAKGWRAWVQAGDDPSYMEEQTRRGKERQLQDTFEKAAESYIAAKTNRRAGKDAGEIRQHLIPAWRTKPVHQIEPSDVRDRMNKLRVRSPYVARNVWTHVVGIFKGLVHDGVIKVSPCASLSKKLLFKGAKLRSRDRYLADIEIFAFWRATGRLRYPAREALRLLLLLGVRSREELAKAKWPELHPEMRKIIRDAQAKKSRVDWSAVNDSVKRWVVPAERFKSETENIVALSDDACAIFESIPKLAGCEFIFSTNGETSFWIGDKIKKRIDKRMLRTMKALARMRGEDPEEVKLKDWVIHDLRRTIRTGLAALKIDEHIAEMVIGHDKRGLVRVYNLHKYMPELRAAREAWAARLREIVGNTTITPANVVSIRRAAN